MASLKQKLTGGEDYMYMDYTRDGGWMYLWQNMGTKYGDGGCIY